MKRNFWKLLGIWTVAILIVNPLGNFPLNDDWAYGQNVFNIVQDGNWIFEDWLAMTLIAQVVWGAFFCKLFGTTFTVLRISTLLLAFLGMWGTYKCFFEVSRKEQWAFWGTLLIAFNPWYFSLSFTFMTDVPFYCCFIWSFYFFLCALKNDQKGDILLGMLFAVLATLIRQFGLLTPLAFGVTYLLKRRNREAIIIAVIPFMATYGIMTLYIKWLEMVRGLSAGFGRLSLFVERLLNHLSIETILERSGQLFFYWGLFLLPFLFWTDTKTRQTSTKRFSILFVLVGLSVYFFFLSAWEQIPTGNVFYNLGLGPKVLKDTYFKINLTPVLSSTNWVIFKIVGFGAALFLIWRILINYIQLDIKQILAVDEWDWGKTFAGCVMLPYLSFLLVDYYFWDRYFLLLLPFWVIILNTNTSHEKQWAKVIGKIIFVIIALFSITATHDYLAWNRARWNALNELTNQASNQSTNQPINQSTEQPTNQIDGGFEFNAWRGTNRRKRNPISKNGKAWWFIEDDKYVVSFGPINCYEAVKNYPFTSFLPPGKTDILLLKRTPFHRQDTILCRAEKLTLDSTSFISNDSMFLFGNGDRRDNTRVFSGNYAVKLTANYAFGLTTRFDNIKPCDRLSVSVRRYDPFKTSGIVLSATNGEQFYEFQREAILQDTSGWDLLNYELTIPANYPDSVLNFYLWNPSSHDVWYDDLELIWKSHK